MTYLLRYGDIVFGSHFENWPSPRYAQFFENSTGRMLNPYVYIIQINSQTVLSTKCLRDCRAGLRLIENDDIFFALLPVGLQIAGCLSLTTEVADSSTLVTESYWNDDIIISALEYNWDPPQCYRYNSIFAYTG